MIDDLRQKLSGPTRHFADLPGVVFFDDFADHVEALRGAEITRFEADGTVGMWLEFEYRRHHFFVDNKFGDYEFHVADAECPEYILFEITDHFRRLLEEERDADAEELEGLH